MLNPLAETAVAGETVLAVWVQTPGNAGQALSAVLGNVGPPTDAATATTNVQTALDQIDGLYATEIPHTFVGGSTLYTGCSLKVAQSGDGRLFDDLLSPISDLGGLFTPGAGPILAFVDYGNTGESSAALAAQAAKADDTGSLGGGLTPTVIITGVADGIDALGAETPYFQRAFKGTIAAVTTANNQAIGPAAAAGEAAGKAVLTATAAATSGIVLILVALIAAELLLGGQARKALA
jgi:hypothetical protein